MQRLILCLDGTWNKADGSHPFTNVVRVRDAIDRAASPPDAQRVYYDEGVGTSNPIDKFIGGALGRGLARNVRQAYKHISTHYRPGDEIYLIGFSRGAYTARSVAGYIGVAGLLRAEACTSEREAAAWKLYHTYKHDRPPGDRALLAPYCHEAVRVKCVAVFDTVGSLGIPTEGLQWVGREAFDFHDTRLGAHIDNALHAIAIDERRGPFEATLWEVPFNPLRPQPRVEQVWFPGVHADIGGGYPTSALADIALHWMVVKLRALGVRFRADAAVPTQKDLDPRGRLHESRKLPLYAVSRMRPLYRTIGGKPLPQSWRWRTRKRLEYKPLGERIHVAALERLLDRKYRPRNLMHFLDGVDTRKLQVTGWDGEPLSVDELRQRLPRLAYFLPK